VRHGETNESPGPFQGPESIFPLNSQGLSRRRRRPLPGRLCRSSALRQFQIGARPRQTANAPLAGRLRTSLTCLKRTGGKLAMGPLGRATGKPRSRRVGPSAELLELRAHTVQMPEGGKLSDVSGKRSVPAYGRIAAGLDADETASWSLPMMPSIKTILCDLLGLGPSGDSGWVKQGNGGWSA